MKSRGCVPRGDDDAAHVEAIGADAEGEEVTGSAERPPTSPGGSVTLAGDASTAALDGGVTAPADAAPADAGKDASSPCGQLLPGQALVGGQGLVSCNGRVGIALSPAGAVYYTANGRTNLWISRGGDKLIMQTDGNLVNYAGTNPVWSSGSQGHPGATFVVQDDGNLVVYSANQVPLWVR